VSKEGNESDLDWEVRQNGTLVALLNAQLRAQVYAEAESKQYPGHHYLIRNRKNPEGEGSAIIHEGRTYLRMAK
jgi:hypothetical protein